jgi:hypothetical protein
MGTGGSGPQLPAEGPRYFKSAVRRLSKNELRATIFDLTGADLPEEVAKLPEDYAEANDVFAFDNKYVLQQPSAALIEAVKNIAEIVGERVRTDAAVRARVLPCKPAKAGDEGCLRTFVGSFGRRALRRPLATAEIDAYVTKFLPFAVEENDFNRATSLVARVLLQDLEFLYRVEVGAPVASVPGLFKLGGYEVAARLAYFLWGSGPDDALLDAAGAGAQMGTPTAVREAALRMLGDPRARRAVDRFHGMWMGYERQPPPGALQRQMLDETNALIERVVFTDKRPWTELFRAKETYADAALAAHYGLPAPAGGTGWIGYGASGRQGILAHGAFLGVERKHEDTSPTLRGQLVRTRLLCSRVPDPPASLMINTDNPPADGDCKRDRYSMWQREGCKSCHTLMDPIGHGLEGFDRSGQARTIAPADMGKPNCAITGDGNLVGEGGPFKGVAGLSEQLLASHALESCLTTQLASFYLGREIADTETATFDAIAAHFRADGRFDDMLVDFVTLPGFGYRIAE